MSDVGEKVRELIQTGQLPARYPDDVFGGYGSGRDRCLVCGKMVASQQVVMEASFQDGADAPRSFFFHGTCFWMLESEWRRLQQVTEPTDHAAPHVHMSIKERGSPA